MARDECRTDTRRTSNSGDRFDKKNEITSFAMSDTLKIWKSIRITSDNDSGASSCGGPAPSVRRVRVLLGEHTLPLPRCQHAHERQPAYLEQEHVVESEVSMREGLVRLERSMQAFDVSHQPLQSLRRHVGERVLEVLLQLHIRSNQHSTFASACLQHS